MLTNRIANVYRAVSACAEQERNYWNSPMRRLGISVISVVHDYGVVVTDRTLSGRARSYGRQILEAAKKK